MMLVDIFFLVLSKFYGFLQVSNWLLKPEDIPLWYEVVAK